MSSEHDDAWLITPEPEWECIDLQQVMTRESFVSGPGSPMKVHYFLRCVDQALVAKAVYGLGTKGPPGFAHGGSIAALLDEAMGGAAWSRGYMVVAASMTVHYRKMLPLPQRCIVEAEVDRVEGRKVYTHARLQDARGALVFGEAEGLFLEVGAGTFAPLGERALTTRKT